MRNNGIKEFPRLYDLDREGTESLDLYVNFIMLVIVRNGGFCAELDTFHRTKIDINNSLLMVGVAAETDSVPTVSESAAEFTVHQRR